MQGWIRRSNKRKRAMEKKKVLRKMRMEKIDIFITLVAVLSIMTEAFIFITFFVLKELDWIIAILSASMLLVSFSIRKMNPYTSFTVLIVVFIGIAYLITITVIDKITPELNANISRIVSAICLGITFIMELIHSYKGMKKISNNRIKKLSE